MTDISTLGQALDQIQRIKGMQSSLATLQYQLASGKKTNLFKGLGTDVIFSERSRADFTKTDNYINNIDIASRRMKMMESALSEVQEQTRNVVNALQVQTQQGEIELESIGDLAGNVYDFLVNLVNSQDGERYLFGGAESLTKPLTDTGTMATFQVTQVNAWLSTSIDNQQLIDSFQQKAQLPDTLVGYSPALASGNAKGVYVRTDDKAELDYTVLANDDGIRDVLVAVSMVKTLVQSVDEVTLDPQDDPLTTTTAPGATIQEQNENFYTVLNQLTDMMVFALDRMDTLRFNLSQKQAQVAQIQENHKNDQATLLETISNVEDADINEVAVKLNALQVQLEASFRVTASLQGLTLVNFL